MKTLEAKISRVLDDTMVIMLLVMFVLVGIQMVARFFSMPIFLGWMQELAQYLLVIVSFVGGAKAFRKYAHIRITFMTDLMPSKTMRAYVIYFSKFVSIAYSIIFVVMSYMYCQHLFRVGTRTMTMPMNMNFLIAYLYIPLCFCFLLNIFYILYRFKQTDFHEDLIG